MVAYLFDYVNSKAGVPWDRHGHRHGHPRRLARKSAPRAGHARGSSPTGLTRAFPREDPREVVSWGCARVHMYACTVHDKLSCTRLQNYTIGASVKSLSVSVPWNSSLNERNAVTPIYFLQCFDAVGWLAGTIQRFQPVTTVTETPNIRF